MREDQELGYFAQIFLLAFAVGLGQMHKQTPDTLSTASFPRGGIFPPTTKRYKQSSLPQPVLLARRAPVSLRLHLRGAGNSSFSPYPPKILGGGSPAKWGEEEPDKLLPALSVPEGKRFFSVCCSDPVRWIRTTFIAPRQPNLPLLSERKIHKGENPASSYNPAWIISWSFKWLCLWFWGAD